MLIDNDIPETEELEMLYQLVSTGQFERVEDERAEDEEPSAEAEERRDVRVVYLMNDAAESFLVFRDCKVIGSWPSEEDGPMAATLGREDDGFYLVVKQARHAVTLFFSSMDKEVHLYNYAALGHFWVRGWEYLRNLEYHLAILRDKRDYLGEEYCNEAELELAFLTEFPPLNYCCYAAADMQYVTPAYPEWKVSAEALDVMDKLAAEAGDSKMIKALASYRRNPGKRAAVRISKMFRKKEHAELTDLLIRRVAEAAACYPDREFSSPECLKLKADAKARVEELKALGIRADIVREEPFTVSRDFVEYRIRLMDWGVRKDDRITVIEEITEEDEDQFAW